MIAAKADPNIQTREGATPLYIASLKGHYEVVHMLISANADVHIADKVRHYCSAVVCFM